MHWMYSLLKAEMLPRALVGHVELRVSGNWDRNICWGSGGSEIMHCPTGEMGARAKNSAPMSGGRQSGMEELQALCQREEPQAQGSLCLSPSRCLSCGHGPV